MKLIDKSWASLATNFDDVEYIPYPVIVQPKLNGFRARWDGKCLTSRQNKVWREASLPSLHKKLHNWTRCNPGVVLDGELYSHGLPIEAIEEICAVKRVSPHAAEHIIDFHAFDIIDSAPSHKRLETLIQIYPAAVAFSLARSYADVEKLLAQITEFGYEGIMLRLLGVPYLVGRTEALIKLKPWKYAAVEILGFKQGLGKYSETLGALVVKGTFDERVAVFNCAGAVSDDERGKIWRNQDFWLGRKITVRYRELSRNHVPLQPQVYKLGI